VTEWLPPGLYERLLSLGLGRHLQELAAHRLEARTEVPEETERPRLLARYLHDLLFLAFEALSGKDAEARQLELCRRVLAELAASESGVLEDDHLQEPTRVLTAVAETSGLGSPVVDPTAIPLGTGDLLVNARGEPGLGPTLQTEIPSADRIDLLCAFIKWNGFRILGPAVRRHLERGRPLRVLTTTYIGATERRALDLLAGMGAQVKVSYEVRRTRLHAKAWLFERASGYSTAFVGSSNLSRSAMLDGLEWNVRLSEVETPALLEKFRATFETYWADSQFEDYEPARDRERFDRAVQEARGPVSPTVLPSFEVRPYPFQEEMLERLRAERERHRLPAAARAGAPPGRGQGLPDRARLHRTPALPVPLRSPLPGPDGGEPRPGASAGGGAVLLPPPGLHDPARPRVQLVDLDQPQGVGGRSHRRARSGAQEPRARRGSRDLPAGDRPRQAAGARSSPPLWSRVNMAMLIIVAV
jgi:HKD family nuclease